MIVKEYDFNGFHIIIENENGVFHRYFYRDNVLVKEIVYPLEGRSYVITY